MKTTWTKGVDSQLEADIKSAFKSATVVRGRLSDICKEKIETALATNKAQYDNPNWCYQQADIIGYRRALEEVMSLLEK
jgi:hypothetical protein